MAAQAHTTLAAPPAIAPTADDVARLLAGASRLRALHDVAAAGVAEAEAGPEDTVEPIRDDLDALPSPDLGRSLAPHRHRAPLAGEPTDQPADSRSVDYTVHSDVVPSYPDRGGLPAPAPLPSLVSALSRRSAIFGAVAVGTVPAAAVAANTGISRISLEPNAGGSGIDPDAELIALGREWQASAERCDRADKALDAAALRTREVEPPEAMFLRRTDGHSFGCLAWGFRDDVRRWYPPGSVEKLRGYLFVDPWNRPLVRDRARRDEIVAAHDAWAAETAAAEAVSGFTAVDVESDAAHDENRALRGRIQTAEADTMAGLMVKARVAGWCWRSAADMREQAADDVKRGTVTGEAMAFSLAADLVAASERQAGKPLAADHVRTVGEAAELDWQPWTGECPVPPNRDWPGIGAHYLPFARIAWCLNTKSKEDLMWALAEMDQDDTARVERLCDDVRATCEFFGAFRDLMETTEARVLTALSTMAADPRYRHRFAGGAERGAA